MMMIAAPPAEAEAPVEVAAEIVQQPTEQPQSHFFERLALRSGASVTVIRIDPPARKRHMPAPGVPLVARAFDEQHFGRCWILAVRSAKNHRHSRVTALFFDHQPRRVIGDFAMDPVDGNHGSTLVPIQGGCLNLFS